MYNLLLPLIILVFISFIFLHLNAKNKMLQQKIKSIKNEMNKQESIQQSTQFAKPQTNPITERDSRIVYDQSTQFAKPQTNPITERDYRIVYDQLAPASQRPPVYVFPPQQIAQYIDIPTRGYPDNYQYIGNLIRTTDEKVIKLFGRQKYARSDQYEYYGVASDGSNIGIKIPIETVRNQEIYDGDEIDVPYFNVVQGKFKAQLFPDQTFRYNPYIL
jgi:hypothetical protein